VDTVGTTGGDMLHGGSGDDTFIVNHVRDVVIEADTNGGNDTVQSSLSQILRDNVENLVLVGSANLSGTGNNLDNSLKAIMVITAYWQGLVMTPSMAEQAATPLNGGEGADVMQGGLGNDTFTVENAGRCCC
jgi:Ca2+-binding RTX toxin-like protein